MPDALAPADEHKFRAFPTARAISDPGRGWQQATREPRTRPARAPSAAGRSAISRCRYLAVMMPWRRNNGAGLPLCWRSPMPLPRESKDVGDPIMLKRDVLSTVEPAASARTTARSRPCCGAVRIRGGVFARAPSASPGTASVCRGRGARVAPPLCFAGRRVWCAAGSRASRCPGQALRRPRPVPLPKSVLRKLRRAGICHNDLAKEQNWLRGSDEAPTSPKFSRPSSSGAGILFG